MQDDLVERESFYFCSSLNRFLKVYILNNYPNCQNNNFIYLFSACTSLRAPVTHSGVQRFFLIHRNDWNAGILEYWAAVHLNNT